MFPFRTWLEQNTASARIEVPEEVQKLKTAKLSATILMLHVYAVWPAYGILYREQGRRLNIPYNILV